MPIRIDDLEVDDANESEWAAHGVRTVEVFQVHWNDEYEIFPNKRGHDASTLMIGPTYGGRLLMVPLTPTRVPGIWRPATAFDASPHYDTLYRNARRRR